MVTDYEGRVDSYLCEHHTELGEPLTSQMRENMRGESPLTLLDAERGIGIIDTHIKWRKEQHNAA